MILGIKDITKKFAIFMKFIVKIMIAMIAMKYPKGIYLMPIAL